MCMCIYVYRNEKMKSLCFILKKKIVLNGLFLYICWKKKKKKRENLLMNIFPIYIGHGIFPSMFSFFFSFNYFFFPFFTFLLLFLKLSSFLFLKIF